MVLNCSIEGWGKKLFLFLPSAIGQECSAASQHIGLVVWPFNWKEEKSGLHGGPAQAAPRVRRSETPPQPCPVFSTAYFHPSLGGARLEGVFQGPKGGYVLIGHTFPEYRPLSTP